jgi:hypothetical protein
MVDSIVSVRHSRMLLAGPPHGFGRIRPSAEIQANSGLDPRLERSGVTSWGRAIEGRSDTRSFVRAVNFSVKDHA